LRINLGKQERHTDPVMFYLESKTKGEYFIPLSLTVHNLAFRLRDEKLLCSQQVEQFYPSLQMEYRQG